MFRVQCPACKKRIKVKEKLYGRKVSCKCGHVLRLPSGPDDDQTGAESILFSCTTCNRKLKVKSDSAGKVTKCPCGAKNQVPTPVPALPAEKPIFATQVAEPFEDLLEDLGDPFNDGFEPRSPLMAAQTYQNPYAPPAKTSKKKKKARRQGSQSDTQQVIDGQKLVIYALLGNLCMIAVYFILGFVMGVFEDSIQDMSETNALILFGGISVLFLMFGIAMLVLQIWGLAKMGRILIGRWWVLIIPGMLIPSCLALIILLVINAMATGYLRGKGVKVGFLGAK